MLIYGKNVAYEALQKKENIKKIYLVKNFHETEILTMIDKQHLPYKLVERKVLDQMVDGQHQGIVLEVDDYKYASVEELINEDDNFLVILDHIEDAHNFGAIIRTCEASSVRGVIIPKDRAATINSTVIKASAGAINNVKIAMVTNLVNTIKFLKKEGFWIIGTDLNSTSHTKIDYQGKIAIVIGNEGSGISRLVKENCDFMATIKMLGEINSLNASVATGIIVFEALRQRENL